MKSSEAKVVAQCVADMIDKKLPHSVREVPARLNKLVGDYLDSYIPEPESSTEIVESGSMMENES